MKIFDITIPIREGMPVWPGNPEVSCIESRSGGGCHSKSPTWDGCSQGTHVDAPFHVLGRQNG